MPNPRIAVIFTGGTIAMRSDTGHGGDVPTLDGTALLETVPGLDAVAEVVTVEWGLVPASHLRFAQVLDIGRVLASRLQSAEIAGAVVVQGTDVIEETAFAWDLLPLPPKPVVVVGAMRSASADDPDGPENLRNAVAVAADGRAAGLGVLVAMAGEIHGADDVRKTHTHDLRTFRSPNRGRLGTVERGQVTFERSRAPARLDRIPEAAALPVHVAGVALDTDERLLGALSDPRPAGLVVAAAGGGNTPPEYLALARRLMAAGVPVALTTRCPSGQVRPGYAFEGGSSRWWEAGAIFTGTLDALKARVLLSLGIGAGADVDALAAICETYGGGRA